MAHFLDTNILIYSISTDPKEARKRERAIELLDDDDGAVSVQVLQEFYAQATRVSRSDAIPHELAVELIESWMRFRVQDNTVSLLRSAFEIRRAYRFSFWDSTIIAAAINLDCDRLYTEDLKHGQRIDALTVVDPFRK
jgi:predicted nucleic acid-binding protein